MQPSWYIKSASDRALYDYYINQGYYYAILPNNPSSFQLIRVLDMSKDTRHGDQDIDKI
jgi:hypothetical protein